MHEQRKKLIHYIIPAMFANISMFILTIVDGGLRFSVVWQFLH